MESPGLDFKINMLIMHKEIKDKINNFGRKLEIFKNPNRITKTEKYNNEVFKCNI